ncbi:MAG: heme lyase CcmF/NrfE family subunit [Alphaproteobacteria bacterium]|nr:heme lyase CcmF/NrfE family subunit [Alphaproteobacteria bacterium]
MIIELGHFALVLAFVLALAQASLPLIGAARGNLALMALARPAAFGQLFFLIGAFAALMHAFVTSDFSVLVVVSNSHAAKPMLYKIAGLWGNHEGSLLLWVLILALFGAAVAGVGHNLPAPLRARVLSVQAMIACGFLSFMLATSNPFARLIPPPLDGQGLNPLLQDPGLAFHPPFLYLGYVGFSMAFSFAVAALIEGRVDPAWARWVRPWTLAAWCFLTIGIAMGSWWAYYELGWGGWWFWDPVENASLMPWLAGTALLHSSIVVEKRDALKSWTVLLAILTFSLSLLGTFIVRSGVLSSVHAFATDPARGIFILVFLVLVIGGSLTLYAVRAPSLKGGGIFAPISREAALVLNNWLLATACATVLLGTLYPLLMDALSGGTAKVTVGAPYYNATFAPLMIPLLLTMALGPLMGWKRGDLAGVLSRLRFALGVSIIGMLAVWYFHSGGPVLAVFGIGLGLWLIFGALTDLAERIRLFRVPFAASLARAAGLPRASWGAMLAHGGVGIAVLGITASTAWTAEKIILMQPGDEAEVSGYVYHFVHAEQGPGQNYTALRGTFEVSHNGAPLVTLQPEARSYPVPPMDTTEAAIYPMLSGDLFAAIGNPQGDKGWSARLYFRPLQSWIWAGAILMALGGVISLSDRRHRVGAPRSAAIHHALEAPTAAPAE